MFSTDFQMGDGKDLVVSDKNLIDEDVSIGVSAMSE